MLNQIKKKKVATLATKAELKIEQDGVTKLQAFDSSYFHGKSHFKYDGTQNYLVFQPMYRYFIKIGNTNHISSWISKGFYDENINPPAGSNNSLAPSLNYIGTKTRLEFLEVA